MPMVERVFRNPPSDKESISLVVEKQHTNKAACCFSSDSVKTEKKHDFLKFTGYTAQNNLRTALQIHLWHNSTTVPIDRILKCQKCARMGLNGFHIR